MKFQSVFIIFNVLLIILFAIICITPALFLESALVMAFWQTNWFILLILFIALAGFDIFYLFNRKLYALLEKEDWPALATYLEEKVIQNGKYTPRLVRLLANAYLVLSDSPGVMSLENKAVMAKPALVEKNALVFGTARILGKDTAGAIHFFETRMNSAHPKIRQWIQWYYGFAMLLNRQNEKALDEFSRLAVTCDDAVITGLAAYFLHTIRTHVPDKSDSYAVSAMNGRERVLKSLPEKKNWVAETGKIIAEIHIAVISKYIDEAGHWIYKESK